MTKRSIAWYAINEDIDPETGCFLETPQAWEAEKRELREAGAPDVEELELISMEAEDRDDTRIEAKVTAAFLAWAEHDGNLVLINM